MLPQCVCCVVPPRKFLKSLKWLGQEKLEKYTANKILIASHEKLALYEFSPLSVALSVCRNSYGDVGVMIILELYTN